MRPDSLFPIASTTKTVTATIAMALAERRRARLDRPIRWALPYLTGSRRITPRMLMSHTSGLADYLSSPWLTWTAWRHPFHRWNRREVLTHGPRRLRFRPGSRHAYSNTGLRRRSAASSSAPPARASRTSSAALIADPLGLADSTFRYGAAPQRRFAHPLRPLPGGGVHDRFGARRQDPDRLLGRGLDRRRPGATAADLARVRQRPLRGRSARSRRRSPRCCRRSPAAGDSAPSTAALGARPGRPRRLLRRLPDRELDRPRARRHRRRDHQRRRHRQPRAAAAARNRRRPTRAEPARPSSR